MMGAKAVILAPLGVLYSAVMRARLVLYRKGALRTHQVSSPTISVGNITTGGTGKTPLVAWVARTAAKEGRRVCILTRGYGRSDESKRVLVSDGERILAEAREGGDEPRQLAEALQGFAAVISDADRVGAARWAEENLKSNLFILDDGFQHLKIARDLDIVALDATNPWGGGRVLPAGRLREPPKGLARADLIILTRAEQSLEIDSLRKQAERLSAGRPVIQARTLTRAVLPLDKEMLKDELTDLLSSHSSPGAQPSSSAAVAAFCALGNSSAFFAHLRREGYDLNYTRAFPDHHFYRQTDVDALVLEAKRVGALALLTTAKDAVKLRPLRFDLPCYVLEIELEFDDEETLAGLIREAISARPGR